MKTPEEMAVEWLKEEYGDTSNWTYMGQEMSLDAFYAGYQAAQRWISVKERLPRTGQEVLALDGNIISVKTMSDYKTWDSYYNGFSCTPSHWMELPDLPKGEK